MRQFIEVTIAVVLIIFFFLLLSTAITIGGYYAGELVGFLIEFITGGLLVSKINLVVGTEFVKGDLGAILGVIFGAIAFVKYVLNVFNISITEEYR